MHISYISISAGRRDEVLPGGAVSLVGRRCLSDATCLIQPRLLSTTPLVLYGSSNLLQYLSPLKTHVLDK